MSLIERVYNPEVVYFPTSPLAHLEDEAFYIHGVPPTVNNSHWPDSTRVRLSIRVDDNTHHHYKGTLVGPRHVLTSGDLVYSRQGWASKITVRSTTNHSIYAVVKAYTFSEWTEQKDPRYNIALLILSKSLGKYTGWSGMLAAPDSWFQGQKVIVSETQQTLQRIEPDRFHYASPLPETLTGTALQIQRWKTCMVVGLETRDKNQKAYTLRLTPHKIEIIAKKIAESFKKYPSFGKADWAYYFGDVGEEPPLPPNIKEILNNTCPIFKRKVKEKYLLTLIPRTVNGRDLTLKTLAELIQKPLHGPATQFVNFYLGEYQDQPTQFSHWTLLSRDVIPDSRNKSFADQEKLVQKHLDYEVPSILDTTIALFTEHVRSKTRLYSDNPRTYTLCQEKYGTKWQLVVGCFALSGLSVFNSFYSDPINLEIVGVGVERKFH